MINKLAAYSLRAEDIDREKDTVQRYFDTVGIALVALDRHGKVSFINNRGCEILGCGPDEVTGRDWVDTFIPKATAEEVREVLRKLTAGETEFVRYFENPVVTRSGEERIVAWHNALITDAEGSISGVLSAGEDITEQMRTKNDYMKLAETYAESLIDLKKREHSLQRSRDAFLNMLEDISESYKELKDLFLRLVRVLVNALDAKSPWTRGHSERVASYAELIAKDLGLEEDEVRNINLAGLLHDVGKIGTYDSLLDKPSRLTREEFEVVKKHPAQGVAILEGIKQLRDIIPIIMYHHERPDGRGYPHGLKGEEIPLGARVLHVADSFDSMTADRPYRSAPGIEYALSEFSKRSGTQFDPRVVEVASKTLAKMYGEVCKVKS